MRGLVLKILFLGSMRPLFLLGLLTLHIAVFSQAKLLQKSWINTSIEELSTKNAEQPDTNYLRYEFKKAVLLFGFEPGWSGYQQTWSIRRDLVTIGFDTWKIEELTDSTLIIYLKGFRRMRFLAEQNFTWRDVHLELIGEFNGKPLYKANRYITPRYERTSDLRKDLHTENIEDYNIRTARRFLMSFVVTETGALEDIKVIEGIAPGYDRNMISSLGKTSRYWRPATYKGQPVQTLMYYEIKFLDSMVDH